MRRREKCLLNPAGTARRDDKPKEMKRSAIAIALRAIQRKIRAGNLCSSGSSENNREKAPPALPRRRGAARRAPDFSNYRRLIFTSAL